MGTDLEPRVSALPSASLEACRSLPTCRKLATRRQRLFLRAVPNELSRGSGMKTMIDSLYILGTVLFTVYGQVVVKWQVSQAGALPSAFSAKMLFLAKLILNP